MTPIPANASLLGMSISIALVLLPLGITAILLLVFSSLRCGRLHIPGSLLVVMVALGGAAMLSLFAGAPQNSASTVTGAQTETDTDAGHGKAVSTEIEDCSNANEENLGLVVTNEPETGALSIDIHAGPIGPQIKRVGRRAQKLGRQLQQKVDRRIGPNGRRWIISGGSVLLLMFVGYVALSVTNRGRTR